MDKACISSFHMSLHESSYWTPDEISSIWDFFVTKSVANSASQRRTASDYGLKQLPFDTLLEYEGVPSGKRELLMADNLGDVIEEYGFKTTVNQKSADGVKQEIEAPIDIVSPRVLCIQPYTISGRKGPEPKDSGKGMTLLTHIRNSLAHGCTYYFPNGMMLLEDKAGGSSGKTTAMMLLPQKAFTDWIKAIDIDARFYFKDAGRGEFEKLIHRKSNEH